MTKVLKFRKTHLSLVSASPSSLVRKFLKNTGFLESPQFEWIKYSGNASQALTFYIYLRQVLVFRLLSVSKTGQTIIVDIQTVLQNVIHLRPVCPSMLYSANASKREELEYYHY